MASRLYAGVGRASINPPLGIAHGGWGAQLHERAESIDLDLWTTVLVLASDDGRRAALVDLDLCLIDDDQARTIREAVARAADIPFESVRVSYTHTHAAPVTARITGGWIRGGRELVGPYMATVVSQTAGAAWHASRTLRPTRVNAGVGSCRIGVNRRLVGPEGRVVNGHNWDGPFDPTVTVVRIDDLAEQPVAVLVHYSCHPTVMGPENRVVTAEYPGVVKRVVERGLGGHCLFLQGAAGDVGPRYDFVADLAVCRRLGARLGHEAARVAWEVETVPRRERLVGVQESGTSIGVYQYEPTGEEDATLALATTTVDLPLRELPDPHDAEDEAEAAEEALYAARARGAGSDEVRRLTMIAKRAAMRAEQASALAGRSHYPLEVHGLRLGPAALVGVSVEPFVALGMEVRRRSPFRFTLFSGYSNGYRNYLPTPEEFPRGGYEVAISPFTPEAPPLLVEAALGVLHRLAVAS
ncbi:MAG TPA: neutral/alkaline non-lysosomal ceramidase N-terminal domain-containing protein [Chloroflexota bacterium]